MKHGRALLGLALLGAMGCPRRSTGRTNAGAGAVVDVALGPVDGGPGVRSREDEGACDLGGDLAACRRAALADIAGHRDADALARARRACEGGYLLGCRTLGWLHENGRGTPRDAVEARVVYGRGCSGGEMGSCKSLGVLWDMGQGGPVDRARAAGLYERACAVDEMAACHNLANLLLGGDGVPRDLARAEALYDRVCRAEPSSRACDHARRLREARAAMAADGAPTDAGPTR